MPEAADARPPGFVPAAIAAGITFATTVAYVALILSQEEGMGLTVLLIAAYFAGLAVCALLGGRRAGPDRVIPLGGATGGLIGSAMIAIFSIGFLLLAAGIFALVAWMRASVGSTARDQLIAGAAAVVAPLILLLFVLLV